MSDVWMTHPELTPAHDVKVARAGVGAKLSSGWQVREDQTDPTPEIVPADPRGPRPAPAAAVDVPADPRPPRPAPAPAAEPAGEPAAPRPPAPAAPSTPAPSGSSNPSPLPRDLKES